MSEPGKSDPVPVNANRQLVDRIAQLETELLELRHRLTEARQDADRAQTILAQAPVFVAVVNQDAQLQYLNRSLPQWTIQEALEKTVFDFTQPEYHATVQEHLDFAFQQSLTTVFQTMAEGPGGRPVWYETYVGPVQENGQVSAATLMAIDITARKEAELALERTNSELEQRVFARTEELAKTNEHLRHMLMASDHERQVIAYEIHDAIIQPIVGATLQVEASHRLRSRNPKRADETLNEGIQSLKLCQVEARRLIKGVRPMALDESGIESVLADLIECCREEHAGNVEFHCNVRFEKLGTAAENSIYRIVQEALRNACRHSESERIRIALVQQEDRLEIVVQDWGCGFQLAEVGTYNFGLEGIRERARLLGGDAAIESTPGEGTCVRVTIPIVEEEAD